MGSPSTPGKVVLVVDDDATVRLVVGAALRKAGYQVVAVASGQEAMTWARNTRPDVVLLDLAMPEMDGVAVGHAMNDIYSRRVPIVIVSARQVADVAAAADEIGAVAYLGKPFQVPHLLAVVEHAVAEDSIDSI